MKKILSLLLSALMFLCVKHQIKAQACTDFAVIVGNWGDASLQRFDGTTGNYSNQLATGIGQKINSVLQYPSPNGNIYLGGYQEVNVVNAFTGAVSFSFTGGSLSGLTEQIVVGLDGKVYVANEGTGAGLGSIARYNATTGVFIDNFISFPSYQPNGLAQDAAGNWYVSTRNSPNQVLKYNSSGVLQGIVTTMGTTQTGGGLKVFNNELYVVTTDSPQTVKVYSLPVTSFPATPVRTLNTGGSTYVGIAFGPDNNLYMADFYNSRVSVWNPTTGALVRNLTNASIANPHGVGFTTCTPCTPPTVGTFTATQATCTGSTANNDAKINVSGLSGGDKYSYGTDTTAFTYASATAYSGSSINITGLVNPSTATTYYVRVYNGSGLCFKTVSVVLQPKNCSTPVVLTPICATNQIGNYSLEDGVSNVTKTIGGSDATFAVTGGDGPTDIHVEADGTYWVNAGSNGGKGSVNGNYLIWYPTAAVGNTNKCTSWAGSSYNFTVGSCYSICYKVAAFNPLNLSEGSVALIEFGDPAVGWTKSFTTGGVLETGDPSIYAVSWNLPAPSAPKDITGAAYTGASGQVIDWKTLDWQTVCINMTPPSTQSGIGINFSTKGDAATGVTKGMALDDISVCTGCTVVCTKPTVGTAVATQATCTGSTANSDAKLTVSGIAGGDKYSYGTDSTTFTYASATAFTGASINITGLANPSTATTYYVRVYNGSNTCYKTVSVVLQPKTCVVACTISATLSQVSCNNNATLASASDDYITALLTPTGTAGERFTLTATRGGNPIAVTFSDGTTIGQLSYTYPTPIRFANGSAGAGNIVLTLTDVANTTCSTTVTLTDPGACAVTTCTPTPQTVSYAYRTTFQTTDLTDVPLTIPKFDLAGGTRTLTKVELKFGMTQATNSLTENTAATNASFKLGLNTSSLIKLGSTVLLDKSNTYSTGSTFITLPAGIVVPASGSYGGDQTYLGGSNLSTLEGMNSWLTPYMEDIVGVSPLTDPRWVTNATGVATNDDDIFYIPTQTFADKDSVTYTTAGDLTQFVGTGNLPLTATTLNGITTTGGGGNLITKQNTKAYAYATVIYTYTCCTKPTVGTPVATQATCTGSTANSDAKLTVSGIAGGDKYSYGTDSTAFTYASATVFTGASINITGLANPSTATTYYVRVYNGLENCYKTVSVVLQPKTCLACPNTTYPLCTGESYTLSTPAGMTNVQWYKNGVAIAAPAGTATSLVVTTIGDYVYTGLPSGGTCKDSLCCPVKIVAGTNCCVKPTVGTAVATQATCTGSVANSDAKIDVSGISGGDKYVYGTDSTSFAYTSGTSFTGASISITGLANPSTATTYYVRVYNGSETCYKTVSVVLQPKTCVIGCTSPTVSLLTATSATCSGAVANADAKLNVSGISGGDKYIYGTSTSGFTYASAIAFTGGSLTIGGLANPTSTTTYYVRVYNGTNTCFTDTQVLLQPTVCNTPCGQPNCISIGIRKN